MTSPTGEIVRSFRYARRSASAFSLIELILVLLILSVAAALIAPMLGTFSRGRSTNDSAAHMLAIMQYAQDQAAITAESYRVNFNLEDGSYWLTASKHGNFSRIASEIGRTFSIPENLELTLEGSETVDGENYIQFDADGRHDMVAIFMTDLQGKELVIACPSPGEAYVIGQASQIRESGI